MAEDKTIDLQSIIDDGLEKPAKQTVGEIVDDVLEVQDPKSLTDLLSESGIIETEEEAKEAIFEEPRADEEKAVLSTASGSQTELRIAKDDPPKIVEVTPKKDEVAKEIVIEEKKEQREVLDEILVKALEKAKDEPPKEESDEMIVDEMTSDIAGAPVELTDTPSFELPDEYQGLDPGVMEYAKDDFLRHEVLDGNVYETGWVEISDFESKILGKELGEAIEHGLDVEKDKLETKVHLRIYDKVSTSLLEEVQLEINSIKDERGIVVKHISDDKTMVVTAESGVYWASALDNKVITRTSENLDPEKHRMFYKVTISKPIDVQKLIHDILAKSPRGVPLYPAVSAGVSVDGGGTGPVEAIQQDIIGIQIVSNRPIGTGIKGFKSVPFTSVIQDWAIITNSNAATYTIEFDVLKSTLAAYPVTATIIGNVAERPSCTAAYSAVATSIASWAKDLNLGDIVQFDVTNVNRYTFAALFIYIESPPVP